MKSFIIHLSKIESSKNSALRLQKELSFFNIDAELFEGSYGDITKKKYMENERHHHPWTFKGPEYLLSEYTKDKQSIPGVVGCFDSHYRLWEHCIKLKEPIMIFEDDAHIVRNYIPVEFDHVLSLVFSHSKKMSKYIEYLDNPSGIPKAADYKPSSMPGAAGYAIKPNAAKKLVTQYKYSFLPADNAINQHVVKIQIHNYMMGKAIPREKIANKSSLIRTNFWN